MNFSQRDIPLQRNTSTSTTSEISSFGGGSGVSTNLGYLELIEQASDLIDDGVILLPTAIGGTFNTVTGENAVYLLHTTTGNTNEGWIFQSGNSTSNTITNVAGLDGAGFLTIQGLNISNGNKSVNLTVDEFGNLAIDKTMYSEGDVIAFGSNGIDDNVTGSTGSGGGLIEQVYSYFNLLNDSTFSDSNLTSTFNAYTGYMLFKSIENLESENNTNQTNIENLQTQVNNIVQDKFFKFVQGVPSATWTIVHNLYKYPSVTVVDSANTACEGAINYIDLNNLTITFSSAFSGDCYLN